MSGKNLSVELQDVANWDKYLETIYLALHNIAEDFYKEKYPDDNKNDTKTAILDRYNPGWYEWSFMTMGNGLVEYTHREIMETIVYVLLAETVYLTSKNHLFNDLKLQNDSNDSENKAIMDAIKDKFIKINNDCRGFINDFLKSTEGLGVFDAENERDKNILDSVKEYVENVFSRDQDNKNKLMDDFCSVVFRVLLLKCYHLYDYSDYLTFTYQTIKNKRPTAFKYLDLNKYACKYFDDISKRGNLDMFISGAGAYNIHQIYLEASAYDEIFYLCTGLVYDNTEENDKKRWKFDEEIRWSSVMLKRKQQYIEESRFRVEKQLKQEEQPKQEKDKCECEKF